MLQNMLTIRGGVTLDGKTTHTRWQLKQVYRYSQTKKHNNVLKKIVYVPR